MSGKQEQREASLNNVYVVMRKTAEHKKSKESEASLVRYIIFVMTIVEYNAKYSSTLKLKCSPLNHELIILSYQTSGTEKIEIIQEPHGNSKKKDAPAYRRKDLEDAVLTSPSVAPRHLLLQTEQNESPILEETNTNLNIHQIYNYWKKFSRENENPDPYLELVRDLLDPEVNNPNEYFNVLDHTQPFVREVSSKMLLRARFLTIFNEIFSRY